MKKGIKIFLVVLFIMAFSFTTFLFADVGNINRYDSGNSTSGSSFGYSGNSSPSSSYSSSDYSSTSSSSDGGSIFTVIVTLVIFLIVLYCYGKSKGIIKGYKDIANISKMKEVYNEFNKTVDNVGSQNLAEDNLEKKIHEYDPNFSRENFMTWANNVFIKIQMAWTNRDWKVIRPFESNELFEQHSAQLQEYINNNKINVIERVSIVESDIFDHRIEGDKEIMEVMLCANMHDYIIDATTKEVLEGDKNKDYSMVYVMTFYRKYGVKTKVGTSNKSTTNCPNCGAPTQITSSGQCEYCNSVITIGEHDWVLSKLEGRAG